jgi:superfamily II DNA or RNA helicase
VSILRPYQEQALEAFRRRLAETEERRLAIQLATGLGKTVTGSQAAADAGSAVIITHTEEITGQWEENLEFANRGRRTLGVVKATRNEASADLVIASQATIRDPARLKALGRRDLIIVDECHHAVAPSWMDVLGGLGAWDGVPTLGLTATLARSDGKGLGHVWEDMVFSRGITWAQRKGYLLDVIPWRVRVPEVNTSASDHALDAMLADSLAPELVVSTWLSKAVGLCDECQAAVDSLPEDSGPALPSYCPNAGCGVQRPLPSTVLFAPLVKSAEAFAAAFRKAGIRAAVVHGDSPDRAEILAAYERGEITVLCNAMVLTEGWDSPRTMCVIWCRKAGGPLFIQGVGRGCRPWLSAEAPPREDQRCILICVTEEEGASLDVLADLSDRPLEDLADGQSMLTAEDEYDLGAGILDSEEREYRGPVRVEEWDLAVQASSKAWKYTQGGAPFLPTAKKSEGYVFVVGSNVYFYGPHPKQRNRFGVRRLAPAPDTSLAMALAEDAAQELGGDIGALLADKGRPWRKQVPSMDAVRAALRAGVTQQEVDRILASRAAGKAGKLSDLTDMMNASRTLDPIVTRIRERATA